MPVVHKRKAIRKKRGSTSKKAGSAALREIVLHQSRQPARLLIPRLPFSRLVREIAQRYFPEVRFSSAALEAIQHASEAMLVQLFDNSTMLAAHANRVTTMRKDMVLALRIQGR